MKKSGTSVLLCAAIIAGVLIAGGCSQTTKENTTGDNSGSSKVNSNSEQAVTPQTISVVPSGDPVNSTTDTVQQSAPQPVIPSIPKVPIGKSISNAHFELITKAEGAFWEVSHSFANNQFVEKGNWTYGMLKSPFDTPRKITLYFQKYWSPEIAVRMKNNLDLQVFGGKYYCRAGDFTSVQPIQSKCKYISQNDDIITISAITNITGTGESPAIYKLRWTGDRWQIVSRQSSSDLNNFIYK